MPAKALPILRCVSAVLGTVAWIRLWTSPPDESPRTLFFLWLAALLLWAMALFTRWPRPRFGRGTVTCAAIIAIALIPRLLALSQAPYLLMFDEMIEPTFGIEALYNHPWEIFSRASGYFMQPYVMSTLQAWPCLFLEPLTGARFASVVLSVISLASTYALARRLFGSLTAVVALSLLACSYWHMLYSRLAHPYMQPIAVVPCALYVLAVGMDRRNYFVLFLAGALLGLSALAYTPARIAVPIAALWLAHRTAMRRHSWHEAALIAATLVLGAWLVYSAQLHSQGSADLLARFQGTTVGANGPLARMQQSGWTSAATLRVLAIQFQQALFPYYTSGGSLAVDDFSPAPLLDPVTLILALIGMGLCVARLIDSNRFLLIVWIGATFLFGQVLTDVPTAAYRAAPLLPALAIAGGLSISSFWNAVKGWKWCRHGSIQVVGGLTLLALVLPPNLNALVRYMAARSVSSEGGMLRFIGAGPSEPVYYFVSSMPSAGLITRFLTPGKDIRDVANLMDDLGHTIDAHRDAIFVLHPDFTDAVGAIRRCYPSAAQSYVSSGIPEQPVLALTVHAAAVAAGRNCEASNGGLGLRARYFSGTSWDGNLLLEQIEDWPLRFGYDLRSVGSVEWSGRLQVPVAGLYRFQLLTRDAPASEADIWDIGTLLAGDLGGGELSPGFYALTVRCRPASAESFCWLRWSPPDTDYAAIPPQFLRPQ